MIKTKYKDAVLIPGLCEGQTYVWRGKYPCALKKAGEFGSRVYFQERDVFLDVENKELA